MSTQTEALRFDADGLEKWSEESRYEVTREAIVKYAEATNDPIPAHRAGEVAPPVFAIVPVFENMTGPVLEVVPLELFGLVLHGEQDFRFHRPIYPGDVLVTRSKMIGFDGLENGSRGVTLIETRLEGGELVNEQYVTFFVRKFTNPEQKGVLSPEHKFPDALRASDPAAKVSAHVDQDQTYRYSEASGDPMPIHLDEEVARDAGLPGIIAHGLCTLAFTSWAALASLADGKTERLKRLAVRFAKPVLPGQDIETTLWRSGSADGATSYVYETKVGDDVVIKDGLVEIAD
ncbi:MAG: MaoC/PaaZ C-terminal domain-containing protein [Segniliparus sp.]|uniref:MaoC/PaaZ C-terminal domain-containing protein n=1 Tax=Segniliparus sp. TaxID=2804064 RepID=UPI003F2E0E7F